jgi:hypothetical protein
LSFFYHGWDKQSLTYRNKPHLLNINAVSLLINQASNLKLHVQQRLVYRGQKYKSKHKQNAPKQSYPEKITFYGQKAKYQFIIHNNILEHFVGFHTHQAPQLYFGEIHLLIPAFIGHHLT